MRRFLLVLLLNTAAMGILFVVVGGVRGPNAARPQPEVEETTPDRRGEERIVPPGNIPLAIHGAQGVWLPTDPESVTVTDRTTGESVVVPDFERYTFQAEESRPMEAGRSSRQAAQAMEVEVRVYREPRTLEEARDLLGGGPEAKQKLLKWIIDAPVAEAEFLQEGLSVMERRERASADEATVLLSGGVKIRDVEEDLIVEGKEIELEPGRGMARGHGIFVVRHPSFTLTGEDLELSRNEHVERVIVKRDAYVQILHELKDANGKPLLEIGNDSFRPGWVRAEGGARIVREKAFGRERLQIVLEHVVHAEQEGGRSLDAERVTVVAWRSLGKEGSRDWKLQRFEADGGAVLQYPQENDDGTPLLVLLRGERLVHDIADDGTATTLLEGRPHVDLRGDVRLEGYGGDANLGLLSATASDQAWVGLPDAGEVPPGQDPARYLKLVLHGGARLDRRDAGVDRDWDRIEGDQLTMLLRRLEAPNDQTAKPNPMGRPTDRLVACSFDLYGDVTLSGTRISGTTEHLFAERLDTTSPILVAEGPNTDFHFHGIRSGERLIGGHREPAPSPSAASDGAPAAARPEREWILERLRALGRIDLRTSLGGPTVGLPALIEGYRLAYDRVTDRARLQGGQDAPALAAVGDPTQPRHQVTARTMVLERKVGIVRAEGAVQGRIYVAGGGQPTSGLEALGLGEPDVGAPTEFRVATNGRIEIRGLLAEARQGLRLDADQVIHIEGGVLAQLISPNSEDDAIDQIRADTVEVALRRIERSTAATVSAPLARAAVRAPTGRSASPLPTPGGKEKRVRWDVEAEVLSARVGDEGLQSVEALEGAVLRSDDGEIRGRRIAYDARLKEAVVQGSPETQAQAIFGQTRDRNEVWSPSMTLRLGPGGATSLQAVGPASAVLLRRSSGESGPRWERFRALCAAPVVVTPTDLQSEGAVEVLREVRKAPGAGWDSPSHLWADRLFVQGANLLSGHGADIRRVVASGPNTHLEMGSGDSLIRLWGQRLDLDVPTSLATLTGTPDRKLRVILGPRDAPRADSEHRKIVVDLKTGRITDMRPVPLILKGGEDR